MQTVESLIESRRAEIFNALTKIANKVGTHGGQSPHYGHVGDLANVANNLREILAFIGGESND